MNHLSLELCKRLREAGFPQDSSIFYWVNYNDNSWKLNFDELKVRPSSVVDVVACPLAEEILERLPKAVKDNQRIKIIPHKVPNGWEWAVYYEKLHFIEHEILIEALAQMWFWLKKENLI